MAQITITYNEKTDTTPSNTAQWTGPDVNEVKSVVNANANDAETRITANANNISTNTGLISTNATNISNKVDKASAINKQTGNYTIVEADNNNVVEVNATATITFPDGLSAGFSCIVVNTGIGTITISATTTLKGKTTLDTQYTSATVYQSDTNDFISL